MKATARRSSMINPDSGGLSSFSENFYRFFNNVPEEKEESLISLLEEKFIPRSHKSREVVHHQGSSADRSHRRPNSLMVDQRHSLTRRSFNERHKKQHSQHQQQYQQQRRHQSSDHLQWHCFDQEHTETQPNNLNSSKSQSQEDDDSNSSPFSFLPTYEYFEQLHSPAVARRRSSSLAVSTKSNASSDLSQFLPAGDKVQQLSPQPQRPVSPRPYQQNRRPAISIPMHQRSRTSSMPAVTRCKPMLGQIKKPEEPPDCYRLRSFSITANGICKLGDCLRSRRSRSSCSVDSSPPSTSGSSHKQQLLTNDSEDGGHVPVFNVAMLGSPNVGKTTLSYQFTTSEYICAYDTSLDDEYGQKTVCIALNGKEAEFNIIDIPASEMSVETFCYTYNVDVFVVVYSVIDVASFKKAEDILLYLWNNDYMSTKGVILVGNKADLERRREISTNAGRKLALTWKCKFIETSSGLDHNVDELLVGIFAQVQLNPKRCRSHNKGNIGPVENGKQLIKQLLKLGRKTKSCENLFIL